MIIFHSKLVQKMWESLIDKGVGSFFIPWKIKREGAALIELERCKALVEAQTSIDVEKIKNGELSIDFKKGFKEIINLPPVLDKNHKEKSDPVINMDEFIPLINESIIAEKIESTINISKAIMHADDILSKDEDEPTDKEITLEWFTRWKNSASQISSNELQQIWGGLLAGEIKEPGTYSLRTMEFIKNLTTEEALRIEDLYSLVFDNCILKTRKNVDDIFDGKMIKGYDFNFMYQMQNLGLISGWDGLGFERTFHSFSKTDFHTTLFFNNRKKVLIIKNEDKDKELKLTVCLLTSLGMEMKSLCQKSLNKKYLDIMIEELKHQEFIVTLGDVLSISDDGLTISNLVSV